MKKLFSKSEIHSRACEIAGEIYKDYGKAPITFVCVLKGAVPFATILLQEFAKLSENIKIEYIRAKSYVGTKSSGNVSVEKSDINAQNIIIIEDIVDTGQTAKALLEAFPNAKLCTLLDKKAARTTPIQADYIGFDIDPVFIVGFGLDFDEKYRGLDYIAEYK
jgi:hypoxanthine phosphoribosyltransferase